MPGTRIYNLRRVGHRLTTYAFDYDACNPQIRIGCSNGSYLQSAPVCTPAWPAYRNPWLLAKFRDETEGKHTFIYQARNHSRTHGQTI